MACLCELIGRQSDRLVGLFSSFREARSPHLVKANPCPKATDSQLHPRLCSGLGSNFMYYPYRTSAGAGSISTGPDSVNFDYSSITN